MSKQLERLYDTKHGEGFRARIVFDPWEHTVSNEAYMMTLAQLSAAGAIIKSIEQQGTSFYIRASVPRQ